MVQIPWEDHVKHMFVFAENRLIQTSLTRVSPGTGPLAPVWSKLRMAKRREIELEWFLWAYLIDSPYKIVCNSNESKSQHRLHVEFEEEPDFFVLG